MPETTGDRSCGPSGCEVTWLTSARLDVADDDVVAFTKLATDAGWGDGLPVVPPTEARVREWCAASGRFPEELLAELPPRNGRCTVEKLAVNAVLAGAPAESMPLLCAAVEAMSDPDFNLFALNTTTSCVVPGVFVNGPVRDELSIPYGPGCFGGVAGPAPAIGRALRLVMRNVGGQVVGESSKSVFGQPGRVTGIVVGEWEERSPWAPLSVRRGQPVDTQRGHGARLHRHHRRRRHRGRQRSRPRRRHRQVARGAGHERVHRLAPRCRAHGGDRAAVGRAHRRVVRRPRRRPRGVVAQRVASGVLVAGAPSARAARQRRR